jgi:diguanylate cyclase (GGDEF)-like protein/putative nucleotidyltransferase with HDIG domain
MPTHSPQPARFGGTRTLSSAALLRVLLLLAVVQVGWFALRSIVDVGSQRSLIAGLVTMALPLFAAVLGTGIWRRGEIEARDRRGWLMLSVACGLSALFTTVTVAPVATGVRSGITDGLAAAAHYALIGCLLVGVLHWMRGLNAAATVGSIVDLACVGLIGYLTIGSSAEWDAPAGASSSPWAAMNLVVWPIVDVLLLLAVVTVLSQVGRQRIRGPEILGALGVLAVAASDLRLTFLGASRGDLQTSYVDTISAAGNPSIADIGWFVGFLAIAVAALRRRQRPDEETGVPAIERSSTWETVWALVPFALLAGALTLGVQRPMESGASKTAFLALLALLVVRCGLVALQALHLGRATHFDALTGAYNHRQFQERLPLAVERAIAKEQPLSLIMIDVDDFELLNETYGHGEGDRFLQEFSWTMRFQLNDKAEIFRNGGDEFAIALPNTSLAEAEAIAQQLSQEVLRMQMLPGPPPLLTMGVASLPVHTSDPHELVQLASGTLYWGKLNGKASVTVYDPAIVKVLTVEDRVNVMEQNARLRAVLALARALDTRDAYTARHSQNVARYSVAIAKELGWTPEQQEMLRIAGLLHDVGKIGVRDSVLRKPGGLTHNEWEEMRQHPVLGARVIADVASDEIIRWVVAHHERHDGRGYPRGLAGAQIPLGARILAVADTFDAMTSSRAYRPALPVLWAIHELVAGVGEQFDPDVVRAFIHAIKHGYLVMDTDDAGRLHAPQAPPIDPEFSAVDVPSIQDWDEEFGAYFSDDSWDEHNAA